MYNVACLKHGTKFGPEYVNNLYGSVLRNTTVPITFHCFTDNAEGLNPNIHVHPLPYTNISGWWQKLYLFSGQLPFTGRVLFLDLDTLIIKNIDHFVTQPSGFVILRDLWSGGNNVGSAIISFDVAAHTQIWNSFIPNPQAIINSLHPHGDQKWIQQTQVERTYWQDLYPNDVVSFKLQCLQGLPDAASIVCFHGKPSIPEAISTTTRVQGFVIPPTNWVKTYWKE